MLQAILEPILLRRCKATLTKEGTPIITLPERHTEIVKLTQSPEELDFYRAIFDRTRTRFDAFVAQGKVLSNYATVLELLLRLRQACDHPFLTMSRSETSQYLDADKLVSKFLKGSVPNPNPNPNPNPKFLKGSVGQSGDLTKAFAFSMAEKIKSGDAASEECPVCLCEIEDPVVTPCAHVMCRECLLSALAFTKDNPEAREAGGASGMCPVCRHVMAKETILTLPNPNSNPNPNPNLLAKDTILTLPSENRFTIDVKAKWKSSAKIDALLAGLEALPKGDKAVIFSQWTAMLDLVKAPLKEINPNPNPNPNPNLSRFP